MAVWVAYKRTEKSTKDFNHWWKKEPQISSKPIFYEPITANKCVMYIYERKVYLKKSDYFCPDIK